VQTDVEHAGRVTVLTLSGRFDAHTAQQVWDALLRLLDKGCYYILVDMARVSFLDSTGLSTLVSGMKRCRQAGGDLVLAQLQQPVRVIFDLTRLDRAFEIYPNRATAQACLGE